MTGIIPLQNYQVIIYGIAGLVPVLVLVMIGVWGTWVIIAVFTLSPWFDRIGRRKSLFLVYSFIIPGGLITVISWARFEAGGSTNVATGAGIIVGMFVVCFGYGGVLNTFAPTVSCPPVLCFDEGPGVDHETPVFIRDHANLYPSGRCQLCTVLPEDWKGARRS